jgi:integrase
LQGLAGHRIHEAGTVTATSAHLPKNGPSYRRIPVCEAVREALGTWVDGMGARHPEGYLFFPRRTVHQMEIAKDPASRRGCYSVDHVSRSGTRALARARKAGLDLPGRFVPRKLRATFVTAMRSLGADYCDLQRYVGQAVPTVLSQHYDRVSAERLGAIEELAQRVFDGKEA